MNQTDVEYPPCWGGEETRLGTVKVKGHGKIEKSRPTLHRTQKLPEKETIR